MAARGHVAGRELPQLVELAVVRQVGLRRHAEDAPAVHDHRAVEEQAVDDERHADDRDHRDLARRGDDAPERGLRAVEERLLVEEVLARVRREPELGEEREDRAPAPGLLEQGDGRVRR